MKTIYQFTGKSTIKIVAIFALLFFTVVRAKAVCNLHAVFTYTIDTTTNIIHFSSTSTSDTSITSWRYDFGDGSASLLENPVHTYSQNGTYNVCLSVIDINNCRDTFCDAITFYSPAITIRDTNLVNTTNTICLAAHQGMDAHIITIINCGHANTSGNVYTINSGCIMVTRSNVVGYNLDTVCFVLMDTTLGVSDTSIFIFSNIGDETQCDTSWLNHHSTYDTITKLHLSCGYNFPLDQNIQLLEDSVLIARNAWARRGFIFYVYDSNTGQNWQSYQIGNTCRGPFNDINCGRYPVNVIEFITNDTDSTVAKQERRKLANFLDSIPCNAYVLGYSFYNAGYSHWLSDSTHIGDTTLFSVFENIGVSNIRQQQENISFAFFIQKCNNSFSSLQIQREGIIDTTFTYPTTFNGTNECKNQSIKKYYSNRYGIVYEITPISINEPTLYYDCSGNFLLSCGYDTFCTSFVDSLVYLNTYWQCQSLCDTITCLLPGDADHDFTVNNYDALAIGLSYNRTGVARPNATTQYTLQACDDWSTTHYYGYNDKFADCNGDGIINSSDALVINQNYIVQAQNHFNHRQSQLDSLPSVTLNFDTLPTMVINGNCDGAELVADINVGSADQPLVNGYGIAFSVNYPFDNDTCFSVTVDLDPNSWFQTNNPVLLFYKNIPQYKRVDVSVVRTDGLPRTGNGRIGRIKMITEGGIFRGGRMSSNKVFDFSVSDVAAINQIGQRINVNGSSTTVNFVVAGVKQNKVSGLKIYPNPTNSKLFIQAKENITSIKIIDLSGRIIDEFLPEKNDIALDFSTTENGMYIIEIKGENSVSYEKIFKQ